MHREASILCTGQGRWDAKGLLQKRDWPRRGGANLEAGRPEIENASFAGTSFSASRLFAVRLLPTLIGNPRKHKNEYTSFQRRDK